MSKVQELRESIEALLNGNKFDDFIMPKRIVTRVTSKSALSKPKSINKIDDKTLKGHIDRYIEFIENYSTLSTVQTAKKKLRSFEKHIYDKYDIESINFHDITEQHIISFFNSRKTLNYSKNTNAHFSMINRFVNYLKSNSIDTTEFDKVLRSVDRISLTNINLKRIESNELLYSLSDFEVNELFKYLETKRNRVRNKLMCKFILSLPLSIDTLGSLKLANITDNTITYMYKNKIIKRRISNETLNEIRTITKPGQMYIFSKGEKPLDYYSTLRKSFHWLYKERNIKITFRLLQNTLVFNMYNDGKTVREISNHSLMSHKRIKEIIEYNTKIEKDYFTI